MKYKLLYNLAHHLCIMWWRIDNDGQIMVICRLYCVAMFSTLVLLNFSIVFSSFEADISFKLYEIII